MCKIRISYKAAKKSRDFRDTNKKARRKIVRRAVDHEDGMTNQTDSMTAMAFSLQSAHMPSALINAILMDDFSSAASALP